MLIAGNRSQRVFFFLSLGSRFICEGLIATTGYFRTVEQLITYTLSVYEGLAAPTLTFRYVEQLITTGSLLSIQDYCYLMTAIITECRTIAESSSADLYYHSSPSFVSLEQKRLDGTKAYDAKTACWIPDPKEGFLLGKITASSGDKTTVQLPNFEVSARARSLNTRLWRG